MESLPAPQSREPLVSVVVPAYRAEPFIEMTLRSIAAQTHRPMEVLVVEDASPDAVAAIADRLAAELNTTDFLVRVLRQPINLGGAAALRRGFAEARGDMICWLSADDAFIGPGKTASQIRALASGGGLSFCRGMEYGPTPSDARYTIPHWVDRLSLADHLFDVWPTWRLLTLLFRNPINGSSVMIPRSSIEKLGTFDPWVGNVDQDGDLWMRYSALGSRFRAVEAEPVFYRIHPGQTTNLTDSVHRGSTVNRLRILLALEESARLGRVLRRSWPALLPLFRREYRDRPAVARLLVTAGLAADCGAAARVVLGWLRGRLERDGLWESSDYEELLAAAREAMGSEEFVRFRRALGGAACVNRPQWPTTVDLGIKSSSTQEGAKSIGASLERIVPNLMDGSGVTGDKALDLHVERYRFAAHHAHAGGRLLDIACGVGYGTRLLAEGCKGSVEVLGVDRACDAIAYATREYGGADVRFLASDAMEFADDRGFDTIVTLETIEHVPNPREYVARLVGWLRPNGVIVASVPTTPSVDANPYHLTDFTEASFRAMMHSFGLREVASLRQTQSFQPIPLLLRRENRMQDTRPGLAGYYARRPGAALRRALSTVQYGFSNRYITIVWQAQ